MTLPAASPFKLVEGGTGEVIPAELLNREVDYLDGAVDHLLHDHRENAVGLYHHTGIRWAVASACLDVRPNPALDNLGAGLLWAHGFSRAPRVRRTMIRNEFDHDLWTIEWEAPIKGARQSIMVGAALAADVSNLNGGIWYFTGDGEKGSLQIALTRYGKEAEIEWASDYMDQLRRVYIMVRQWASPATT